MQHVRPPPQRLLDAPADPHACAEKEKDVKSERKEMEQDEEMDEEAMKEEIRQLFKVNRPDRDPEKVIKDFEGCIKNLRMSVVQVWGKRPPSRSLASSSRPSSGPLPGPLPGQPRPPLGPPPKKPRHDARPDGRMKPPEPVNPPSKPPESLFWRHSRPIPMAKRFKRDDEEGGGGGMHDTHATHDMHKRPRVPQPPPKPAVPPAPWWPPPPPPPVFRAKSGKARTHHACACIHTYMHGCHFNTIHSCQRLPQDGHPAGKVPNLDMETLSMHACMHEN